MIVSKLRTKGIPTPNLMLCNNPLEQVAEYKYLGVTIINNLTWSVESYQHNFKQSPQT